jgi:hypothetical protein
MTCAHVKLLLMYHQTIFPATPIVCVSFVIFEDGLCLRYYLATQKGQKDSAKEILSSYLRLRGFMPTGSRLQEDPGSCFIAVHECVNCGAVVKGADRAVVMRRPTLFPENAPQIWRISRDVPCAVHRLCRSKECASFLDSLVLPSQDGVDFEDSIYHRGVMRFIGGPVVERLWPIRKQTFFADARSWQMKRFCKVEHDLIDFCTRVDAQGLRCVGAWSGQAEIDTVHLYACLFAQETSEASGVWMPYWYRDARLIGCDRVAYLIKGAESYQGAVMMDTQGCFTLAWVWLTPRLRRRGIFLDVWRKLEGYHPGFNVL